MARWHQLIGTAEVCRIPLSGDQGAAQARRWAAALGGGKGQGVCYEATGDGGRADDDRMLASARCAGEPPAARRRGPGRRCRSWPPPGHGAPHSSADSQQGPLVMSRLAGMVPSPGAFSSGQASVRRSTSRRRTHPAGGTSMPATRANANQHPPHVASSAWPDRCPRPGSRPALGRPQTNSSTRRSGDTGVSFRGTRRRSREEGRAWGDQGAAPSRPPAAAPRDPRPPAASHPTAPHLVTADRKSPDPAFPSTSILLTVPTASRAPSGHRYAIYCVDPGQPTPYKPFRR